MRMNRFKKIYPEMSMGEVTWFCDLGNIYVDPRNGSGHVSIGSKAQRLMPNSGAVEQFSEALIQAQNFGLAFRFLKENPELGYRITGE